MRQGPWSPLTSRQDSAHTCLFKAFARSAQGAFLRFDAQPFPLNQACLRSLVGSRIQASYPFELHETCPSLSEKSCRAALPSVTMARLAAHLDPVREDTSYRPLQPTSTSEHPNIARFLSSPQVKQRLTTFSSFSRPVRMTPPGGRAPGIAFGDTLLLERFQLRAVLTNRPLTPPVAPRAGPCYRALTKHQDPFHCPCVNKSSFRDPRRLPSTRGYLHRLCKAQTTKGRLSTTCNRNEMRAQLPDHPNPTSLWATRPLSGPHRPSFHEPGACVANDAKPSFTAITREQTLYPVPIRSSTSCHDRAFAGCWSASAEDMLSSGLSTRPPGVVTHPQGTAHRPSRDEEPA